MKILLVGINAKYIHSSPALYYLLEYVRKKASEDGLSEAFTDSIKIVEYTINRQREELLRDIFLENADVIAFSCYLWNISYIHELCEDLSKVCPDTDLWLGGPEVSFDPDVQLKKYPMVRGIICGEGEEPFYRLCKTYYAGASTANIGEDQLPSILKAASDLDFDDVPFPYEDLSAFNDRIVYYETSRGCPFRCAYCLSSVDRNVRLRSISKVQKELQLFLDAKVPQVKFVDRTFNCNRDHTRTILEYIKEHDNGVTNFHFEIACELINEDELSLLSSLRRGQVQLEIGVQTTNPVTLKAIDRASDIGRLKSIVAKLLNANNMHIHLDLIAGLPFEDLNSFKKSFNEVYSIHSHDLQLGFLKILKGSPMEARVSEYDIRYSDMPPYEVLSTKWLSFADVLQLKRVEEMLEVYYNSGQFKNTIAFLERYCVADFTFYDLYLSLADYYKENGYDNIDHNRYKRYSILRDWWLALHPECEDDLTEVLLIDLYLRDNVKSRPAYGDKGLIDKTLYKEFFKSGRYLTYLPDYKEYSSEQAARMVHIEKTRKGCILFDYLHRDVITGDARTMDLDVGVSGPF